MTMQSQQREEKRKMTILQRTLLALGVAAAIAVAAPSAQAEEQYFGIPSSRVGPYSAMGTGYYGGIIDYLNYVNMKHGGVNGVTTDLGRVRDRIQRRAHGRMLPAPLDQGRSEDGRVRHARHARRLCRNRAHGARQCRLGAIRLWPHRCRRRQGLAVGLQRRGPLLGADRGARWASWRRRKAASPT